MSNPCQLVVTKPAKADLRHIHRYIAKENPKAATKLADALVDKMFNLAQSPYNGAPRDWIAKGLRALPYKSYCIYFHIDGNKLVVLRILHSAQDVESIEF